MERSCESLLTDRDRRRNNSVHNIAGADFDPGSAAYGDAVLGRDGSDLVRWQRGDASVIVTYVAIAVAVVAGSIAITNIAIKVDYWRSTRAARNVWSSQDD